MESHEVLSTTDDGVSGIQAESQGSPTSGAPDDPFLGVPVPGGPAVKGGVVEVDSSSNIRTEGGNAHGILAKSSTTGYSDDVKTRLSNFSSDGINFTVTSVENKQPDGTEGEVGKSVQGQLIDEDGEPIDGSGGTFTVNADGTYSFEPGEDFQDMAVDEERRTTVAYTLHGTNLSTFGAVDPVGALVVTVTRTGEGFEEKYEAYFEDYGVSLNPVPDPENPDKTLTVFPDLDACVQGLLADAGAGGTGNSVSVASSGTIHTMGEHSQGILAESQGGKGGYGRGGSISHSAGAGGDGKSGGNVAVTAGGRITTDKDYSVGILADSVGGDGGHGGNGGFWRYGARGGTGGSGGAVSVNGSATIHTYGDYSSGILAISEGGNGGDGGSGKTFTGGGNGGYGGQGHTVSVNGGFDITTEGVESHGIWAKSVGGDAGTGGSGGWISGSPGGGGQATDGGSVTVSSGGAIETKRSDAYGIYAQSVGGFGGRGGNASGIFYSHGGSGNSAGSGGDVAVTNRESGSITTHGERSHGIFAESVGGGGGSGGNAGGLIAMGGEGGTGGNGGSVEVTNDGGIQTLGDNARGIYAQSIGGGGGDGGSSGGFVSIGGSGSGASVGGTVTVTNNGEILTKGYRSHGIFAESIGGGGGDGGDSGGIFSVGGDGGAGNNADEVTVVNTGIIRTGLDENGEANSDAAEACGIFAQSVGGGGGNGGGAVAVGAGVSVAVGGDGGAGGDGAKVEVTSGAGSEITTEGDLSHGIFAQSVGGGGGNGGMAVTANALSGGSSIGIGIGGAGGAGGNGKEVAVHGHGLIETGGDDACGIFAQSVGGGGGNGGFSISGSMGSGLSLNVGIAGKGGSGGIGSTVSVGTELDPIRGGISTEGDRSYGILAQSVGGGGGNGGFSVSGSVGGSALNLSVGGDGGSGNHGGEVKVFSSSRITTIKDDAHAIFAQSVGGSGGNGGAAVSASVGVGTKLNFGFGGDGGSGANAGAVTVGTEATPIDGKIHTYGDRSYGILAQSVGGGGGNGGSAITGDLLGGVALGFAFGGEGEVGGTGDTVHVRSAAEITTEGAQSYGILAQSVGGGGGNGGLSLTASVTAFGGLNFSMGGDAGDGSLAKEVDVVNSGNVETWGEYSHGVLAQSVGGGGGTGGTAGSATVNFSSLIPVPPEIPIKGSANFSISLGGKGGDGGIGGNVDVDNEGRITTHEDFSYGVFAQSVGGGGGAGGRSIAATGNISLPEAPEGGEGGSKEPEQLDVQVDFALAIGGSGGSGNNGGEVDVVNQGAVETWGDGSHAIYAQSVGGGGGVGGNARALTVSIDPSNWSPADPPPDPLSVSKAVNIAMGGKGGAAGDGGKVEVANTGSIVTHGADSYGVFAQSIGGGGGDGGGGYHGLDWADLGVPDDLVPYFELMPIQSEGDLTITVGGSGGSSGNADEVHISNTGDIMTFGDGSFGILAQSIGGGGGTGGIGASGEEGSVVIGGGGEGGAAGNGEAVTVDVTGNIDTFGVSAYGILAQSIGGGGGIAGNIDRGISESGLNLAFGRDGGKAGDGGKVTVTTDGNITTRGTGANGIFAQSIGGGGGLAGDIGPGIGFAGSVGGEGSAGEVDITHTGNIATCGDNANGIFAQSASGGLARRVEITLSGNILAQGANSSGIVAQSLGGSGNGDIFIDILGGSVVGGTDSGAGITIRDGEDNAIANHGTITTVSGIYGTAVSGDAGNETVDNYGAVVGSVDLGLGGNAFNNKTGASMSTGASVDLGAGNTLTNEGTLSPGGKGHIQTTALTGDLVQKPSGSYSVDLDPENGGADRLNVSGTADLSGSVAVNVVNVGRAVSGTRKTTILNGAGGVADSDLKLVYGQSAVAKYELLSGPTEVVLKTDIDFSPSQLNNGNRQAIGDAVNAYQLAGGSEDFGLVVSELFRMTDLKGVASAYDQLSPVSYSYSTKTTFGAARQYTGSLQFHMNDMRGILNAKEENDLRKPIQLAYNGSNESIGELLSERERAMERRKFGLWLQPLGQIGDQDGQDGLVGYDYHMAGVSGGFDYLLTERLIAGVGVGYYGTHIDLDDKLGTDEIDSYAGSIYGTYFADRFYLESVLSYARNRYDNYRHITVGSIRRTAHGDHGGDVYSASLAGGYDFGKDNWTLQPFAAVNYTYLDEEGFEEAGAGSLNLRVKGRETDSLTSQLGLRLAREYEVESGGVIPELSAAWLHDFDIDDERVTASFAGSPGAAFTVEGREPEENGLLVGAGISYVGVSGFTGSIQYGGEFREDYTSHGLYGLLRYNF